MIISKAEEKRKRYMEYRRDSLWEGSDIRLADVMTMLPERDGRKVGWSPWDGTGDWEHFMF